MWIAEKIGINVKWLVNILVDNKAGVHFQKQINPDSKLKGVFDMRLGWLKELHDRKKFIAVNIKTDSFSVDLTTMKYHFRTTVPRPFAEVPLRYYGISPMILYDDYALQLILHGVCHYTLHGLERRT